MDCLRSFTLNINQNFNFASPVYTQWNTTGVILPWTVFNGGVSTNSVFDITGFKNINVYGISMVGSVYPLVTPALNQGLVQDWGIQITITGTYPLVGGTFANNSFLANQGFNSLFLSKYQNEYKLISPIESVKDITISGLQASGIQLESGFNIDLSWQIALIVYYTFEGE
jgi:hypothetical protein